MFYFFRQSKNGLKVMMWLMIFCGVFFVFFPVLQNGSFTVWGIIAGVGFVLLAPLLYRANVRRLDQEGQLDK